MKDEDELLVGVLLTKLGFYRSSRSYFVEVGCHRGSKPQVLQRAILNGQDFVKRFNTYQKQAPTWNNIHVQTNRCPGSLFGFRWSDWTNLQNDLQVVVDGGVFPFFCANGNYILFSRVQPGEMPVLIMLNITPRVDVCREIALSNTVQQCHLLSTNNYNTACWMGKTCCPVTPAQPKEWSRASVYLHLDPVPIGGLLPVRIKSFDEVLTIQDGSLEHLRYAFPIKFTKVVLSEDKTNVVEIEAE
nr:hypothetical protein [Tanacetum cinerariifolium]